MAGTPITAGAGAIAPPARLSAGKLQDGAALLWVAAQVGVILLLARAFHLESPAFYGIVLPLAGIGFLVHHWLPRAYQPWFFAALSVAGIFLIFGLVGGAWLVGIGLGLIALCHLPIAFRWRIALILLAAAGLVAMRATWLPTPWPGAVWPVLGSMFMFRLAMYLYDLKHRGPAAPGFVLSYFFLLPNSVFLLFPVIDFQTFRRTHYDKPAFEIYGEGIRWMFRGLTHLVIYRLIYQYAALSPADVTSTATLVQYLLANYGLYLRVSGQFHMIVGLLHLFGFRLPETHRFFYLASSFSDLWRRINIYWKDFMQKMVYLPVVFGLKRHGETAALVGATMCVVIATWLLHSYQWFWLLGEWLLSATDMAFWGVIGLLLIANSLREQRRGRARQLTAHAPASSHAWRDAVQTAGMFALMAVMWGIWTSPTFEDFRVMLRAATWRPVDFYVIAGTLGVVAVAAYLTRRLSLGAPSALAQRPRWQHPLVVGALPLALMWAIGEPTLEGRVPATVQAVARQARVVELNKYDAERMQRGYYEQIVGVNRFNGELWEVYARAEQKPGAEAGPDVADNGGRAVVEDDHGNRTYSPLLSTEIKGGKFNTNRWGLRDKDYEKKPGAATRRMAIIGPSYVVGIGVHDDEVFEQLVEDRLNAQLSPKTGQKYEFLNFGLAGLSLAEMALILDSGRVTQFNPGVVLVVGHMDPQGMIVRDLWKLRERGQPIPRSLSQLLPAATYDAAASQPELTRLLRPHWDVLPKWALQVAADATRRMGAQPVFALIPVVNEPSEFPGKKELLSMAAAAGFAVIDMQNVFEGYDNSLLARNGADFHPNADGHRIIGRRLLFELLSRPEILGADAGHQPAFEALRAQVMADEAPLVAELRGRTPGPRIRPATAKSWKLQMRQNTVANLEFGKDEADPMRVIITRTATQGGGDVKLRQAPFALVKGRKYRLTFRARADAPRPMAVGVSRNARPWGRLGFYERLDLTKEWKNYEWTFAPNTTEINSSLFFDLGASLLPVEVSHVVLRDVLAGRDLKPAGGKGAEELPEVATVAEPPETIEGWEVETRDGASAKLQTLRKEDWLHVGIERIPRPAASSVRLRKVGVPIVRDHRYALSFWVKADATRPVLCGLARGASPGNELDKPATRQAETWWQELNCTFTAADTDANGVVFLDLGTSPAAVELSKIQLRNLSTGAVVMSTDPAWRR